MADSSVPQKDQSTRDFLESSARSSPGPQTKMKVPVVEPRSDPSEVAAASNPHMKALEARKANLEATLASLQAERSALVANAKLPSGLAMPDSWSEEDRAKSALSNANAVIKEHITLLHKYNEIKDIGQGLMGLIADSRGVRVAVVMEDFGMDAKD